MPRERGAWQRTSAQLSRPLAELNRRPKPHREVGLRQCRLRSADDWIVPGGGRIAAAATDGRVMAKLRPHMGPTRFTTWTESGSALPTSRNSSSASV